MKLKFVCVCYLRDQTVNFKRDNSASSLRVTFLIYIETIESAQTDWLINHHLQIT